MVEVKQMSERRSSSSELTVGQVADRSGVTVSALHFYEAEGLIRSTRTAGNQRRFAREVLRRVAFIRASQTVGTPTRRDWERLSAAWRDDLDQRITGLQHLRDRLSGCIGCGCLSLGLCKLMNPDDRLGRQGPGPHNL
jgi:MerR family redox-sensitive transcriptional activator SoxR